MIFHPLPSLKKLFDLSIDVDFENSVGWGRIFSTPMAHPYLCRVGSLISNTSFNFWSGVNLPPKLQYFKFEIEICKLFLNYLIKYVGWGGGFRSLISNINGFLMRPQFEPLKSNFWILQGVKWTRLWTSNEVSK